MSEEAAATRSATVKPPGTWIGFVPFRPWKVSERASERAREKEFIEIEREREFLGKDPRLFVCIIVS
jgi:hypothetical protein